VKARSKYVGKNKSGRAGSRDRLASAPPPGEGR